ncbi:MAG: DNA gyrase/topoisomerase IV subunit A, partial [Cytophagales bacterium]|nr:DNA gyrase/topoisomerase IV subunit A [Cytophagales bacterium]
MEEEINKEDKIHEVTSVNGLYENWFLEYASYVILERAVPAIEDGLKPVQRRILHAMKEMDDGRFNKVANVIGQTMQYHPHGDASINEAMVNLGQKDLLIETQGNWGDIRTGDGAAAPRYIEARLSKFALEVAFNPDTTDWQLSYDGRKREPITLPMKFPLLLAQGVEGIAVGLSTKVLPHNFIELIHASISHLKGESFVLYPDFHMGGAIDVADYNDGLRGGKVRVRARIEELDKKTLVIKDIPFGTTTTSLMESIVKANDQGKIKIKKVIDNTAADVEIQVQLLPGISPDITIDALYAFTDCEVSISPNACVIIDSKPRFMTVSEILRICTEKTKDLLRQELEIKKAELQEKIFFSSLLKIFIEEGMYKNPDYEAAEDDQVSFAVLNKLYAPHFSKFYRKIENEDYLKVMAKPLSSIRRFDVSEADEKMRGFQDEITQVDYDLAHLTDFSVK